MKTINRRNYNNKTRKVVKGDKSEFRSVETIYENRFKKNLDKHTTNIQGTLIKLFNKPYAPSSVSPRSDFYTYINYMWLDKLRKHKIKDQYYVEVDDFRITQDTVYKQLIGIIEDYTRNNHSTKSKMIKNVYNSMLGNDYDVTRRHIRETHDNVKMRIKEGNMWKFIADINKNQIISWGCPISWNLAPDSKNAKIFRNTIIFPQLSLYDANLYFEPTKGDTPSYNKYRNNVKARYLLYLEKLFTACLGKGHKYKVSDIFEVEKDILLAMGCDNIKNDSPDYYNLVEKTESLTKYGFDWKTFSEYLGFEVAPENFVCSSLNYLSCICKLLKDNWNTEKWEGFWIYIYLRQIVRFDRKLLHIHYDFQGKFLRGMTYIFPKGIYPIFGVSLAFNTFLTNEYIQKYKDEKVIDYVKTLGNDLIKVFIRIIENNKWMQPKTRATALKKLRHLNFLVVEPGHLREDPLLDYKPNDGWGNMLKITEWTTQQHIRLNNTKVLDIPVIDWSQTPFKLVGKQSYIVNAMYTPIENSIYIPLGYLQKPFVDLDDRGIEYNLAHIGFTLGHEMSHSLDDMGSKYDYKGNLHDWWTPQDKKKYKLIQQDIISQYEKFASYDGLKYDASPSIGEDLADISGLAICNQYLRDFQEVNEDIIPIRSLSFQIFYIYYAMQERQYIAKRAIEAQLKTNPHPPDKYRANVPLSRLELFRSIYNIKSGDKMFWKSTSTIWD
jgi:putative endopeptidase